LLLFKTWKQAHSRLYNYFRNTEEGQKRQVRIHAL